MFHLLMKNVSSNKKLETSLQELVLSGFIEVDGCYFLQKLFNQQKHISSLDFIDKTGYECFVNSIHIDDYIEEDLFIQGLLYSDKIISEWLKLENNTTLEVILSETDFGFQIKFHVSRPNENWILESDLNIFKEALLILGNN